MNTNKFVVVIAFFVAASLGFAQGMRGTGGGGMAGQPIDGTTIKPKSIVASGNITSSTLNVGTTSTTTRSHMLCEETIYTPSDFNTKHAVFGRNATSGASSGGVWLSYHTVDNEGIVGALSPATAWRPLSFAASAWKFRPNGGAAIADITSTGAFNSVAASGNQAFTCTNVGCRLSLGNTGRYLLDDGTNLEFVAPVQGTSFEALATTGNSFVGGNSSTSMLIGSNTPDSLTTSTVPAIRMRALNDITDADAIFTVEDFAGNQRFIIAETGRVTVPGGPFVVSGQIQSPGGFSLENYFLTSQRDITIPDSGGAGAAAYTLANSTGASEVLLTCNDADGCDVALSESGATLRNVKIYNVGTNTVNINDTAGVTEMAGNFAMGQWDNITFHYTTDRWVENARSNN